MRHERQLGLPFIHPQRYEPVDFLIADSNTQALAWLEDPAAWPGLRLAVHGDAGSGKTHFLYVFTARHGGLVLPGAALRGLSDLPVRGVLAVDDADAGPEPAALLHVLNMAAEQKLPILLAGRLPPARWAYSLPDLTSRLRAMPVVALRPPDDALLQALLARLLAERQLAVPRLVQDFIRLHLPRTGDAVREAAARLDRASLAMGRKVTKGLAAMVLADMGCDPGTTAILTGATRQASLL